MTELLVLTAEQPELRSDAIWLLDKHATHFADKDNPPPKFHDSFTLFAKVFKKHNYPVTYISGGGRGCPSPPSSFTPIYC